MRIETPSSAWPCDRCVRDGAHQYYDCRRPSAWSTIVFLPNSYLLTVWLTGGDSLTPTRILPSAPQGEVRWYKSARSPRPRVKQTRGPGMWGRGLSSLEQCRGLLPAPLLRAPTDLQPHPPSLPAFRTRLMRARSRWQVETWSCPRGWRR